MNPLQGEVLLQANDLAAAVQDSERAPAILSVACPQTTSAQWAAVGIPELIQQLLHLRQISFGPVLRGYLPCPACDTRLEFTALVPEILQHLQKLSPAEPPRWILGNVEFSMRPVNTFDLLAVRGEGDAGKARQMLLERCVVTTGQPDAPLDRASALNESQPRLLEMFNELHQGTEIVCNGCCDGCGTVDRFDLDIARFLWSEVRSRAIRLLREVHELAVAYGWPERAILDLSPARRNEYLAMLQT
jgi:hypothetical protein